MQYFYGGRQKTWKWLPMTFGKYSGSTLPEIGFLDPAYITWLIEKDVIKQTQKYSRELARQAKYVAALITRILPAEALRDEYEFLILIDSKGAFCRVVTVKKGSPVPKKYEGKFHLDKRCDVLDANIFDEYKNPKRGSKRMASSLRKILFPFLGRRPATKDFGYFMITSSNFGWAMGVQQQMRRAHHEISINGFASCDFSSDQLGPMPAALGINSSY